MDQEPKRTRLWADVHFTEDEARSILKQIDHIATPSEARRKQWNRIENARAAFAATGPQHAASSRG